MSSKRKSELSYVVRQYRLALKKLRAGDRNAFLDVGLSADELHHAGEIARATSVGWAKDGTGKRIVSVHVQQEAYVDSQLIRWLTEQTAGRLEVVYTGQAKVHAGSPVFGQTERPIVAGGSVSHFSGRAGTVGFIAREAPPSVFSGIVSCNHVIALENDGRADDPILQTSTEDGGVFPGNAVALLWRWINLGAFGNISDAAYARLQGGIPASLALRPGMPRLTGQFIEPNSGVRVMKAGRSTGVTAGQIVATGLSDVTMLYPRRGFVSFDQVFGIRSAGASAFSDGGDSGSLVVTPEGHAVGLIFGSAAGDASDPNRVSYGCRIGPILSKLGVSIATG